MENVTSWSWPNMFDVARGQINLYSDTRSIVNRVKLLLLTEPTELYMVPNFGVGLKKHLFKYNNDNVIAIIRDELIEQLRLWEPCVIPEETKVTRGLTYTKNVMDGITNISEEMNDLNLTITLTTSYSQVISFGITAADLGVVELNA